MIHSFAPLFTGSGVFPENPERLRLVPCPEDIGRVILPTG